MAVPKRRTSRHRRGNRRIHQGITLTQLVRCANCSSRIRPHTVCYSCGFYRGRQVMVGANA